MGCGVVERPGTFIGKNKKKKKKSSIFECPRDVTWWEKPVFHGAHTFAKIWPKPGNSKPSISIMLGSTKSGIEKNEAPKVIQRTLTVGERITVQLVSRLTELHLTKQKICCYLNIRAETTESKPVKQKSSHTAILPPTMSALWLIVPYLLDGLVGCPQRLVWDFRVGSLGVGIDEVGSNFPDRNKIEFFRRTWWRRLRETARIRNLWKIPPTSGESQAHRSGNKISNDTDIHMYWGVKVKRLTKICWHLIAPPIRPRLLGQGRFKPCLRPGYFLLLLSDCMMETFMLLVGVRVHEHWWHQ